MARTGVLGAGTLLVVAVIGLGWALAAMPRSLRLFELVALSPAVGIAALVVTGMLVDALGFRLGGAGGTVTPVLAAGAGGLLAWLARRRPTEPNTA
jgi:hypothetical protein